MSGVDQAAAPAPYRVLATCAVFEPGFRGGGAVRSVAHIVDSKPGTVEVMLVTADRDLGSAVAYPGLSNTAVRRGSGATVFYLNTRSPQGWLRLARQVRARTNDLLYVNSLWSRFSLVPILAVAVGLLRVRTVLMAPRGELSPGALQLKRGKKRLFLLFWSPLLKRLRVRWQASSELEEAHIRQVFPWAEVVVNGNEAPLPAAPIEARTPNRGPLRLVFISRISPKKNLDFALAALAGVTRPVEFDIFGPLEDGAYWARCQRLMATLPGHVRARYLGELAPDQVRTTFSRYDGFLFPTLGENFGHVIVESLAASCPVICSDETPWSGTLIEKAAGVVVRPLTVASLTAELASLAGRSPEERLRARQAAGEAYRTWRRQAPTDHVLEYARRSY